MATTTACPSSTCTAPVLYLHGAIGTPVRRTAQRVQFDAEDGHFFFRRRVAEVLGALVAAAQPPKARAAAATSSS